MAGRDGRSSHPSRPPGLPALSSRPRLPKAPGQLLPGAWGVVLVTQAKGSRLGHSLGAGTPRVPAWVLAPPPISPNSTRSLGSLSLTPNFTTL